MDLKNYLLTIFPNKGSEKYSSMIDELSSWGINSTSDLKCINEKTFKDAKYFTRIEAIKLIDYLKNPDSERLQNVLMEIFAGLHCERLMEIEKILKEIEVFARKDVLVIDTNKLSEESLLSEDEIKQIELFIKNNNHTHYYKMIENRNLKNSDLKSVLMEIFSHLPDENISRINDILKSMDVTGKKDLLHINTNKLLKEKILSKSEVSRIENYLRENNKKQYDKMIEAKALEKFNPELLEHVLKDILSDTPMERLKEIKQFLANNEIYSGKDLLFLNMTNSTIKHFFTKTEAKKISDCIKKKIKTRHEDIMENKSVEDEKKNIENTCNMKVYESRVKLLVENKNKRLQELQNCRKKGHNSSLLQCLFKCRSTKKKKKLLNKEKIVRHILKEIYKEQFEMGDIENYLQPKENHEIFENVLHKLFNDIPKYRLKEIKMIFNEIELYLTEDALLNESKWKNERSLSMDEIAKIGIYINQLRKEYKKK